jgi:site-specific DNA-methyltransferase (adenine-specific)
MKGRRELCGSRPRTILHHPWSGSYDPVHPTVKPVVLLQELIKNSTHRNELVIDPFCGAGTTLLAARNLGRRAIGIELSKEYCERAIERLESKSDY